MRFVVAACLALLGCRAAVHRGFGGLEPRHQPGAVKLLVLPPSGDEPEATELDDTMRAALQQDPHVQIERTDNREWRAACDYVDAHALDYIVQMRINAFTDVHFSCRDSLLDIFKGNHEHPHSTCSAGPPYSRADITIAFFTSFHCGTTNALTHEFRQRGDALGADDYHPFLHLRAAEATQWMRAHLPHYFSAELPVIAADDSGRATVAIGSDDGVREGDAFEVFAAKDSAGFAHAEHVTPTTTVIAPTYGGEQFVLGEVAVQRGRPWMLEVAPTFGASTMHVAGIENRAFLAGAHARVHAYRSGPILGFGVEGQLASAQPTVLLGPEVGWWLHLHPQLGLHAVVGGRLVNAELEHDTVVGWSADAVAGATYSSRYGFLSIEGGYQWSTSMATMARPADLEGPLVRASFGFTVKN
jgi:hypothetical protein